jgi:hypothetical protein
MNEEWDAWRFLLGQWESDPTNDPSQSTGRFSFRFDLGENILIRENRSISPKDEAREESVHEDLMIVYCEVPGSKQAIYFDNEKHVIHYRVNISKDEKTITLESEATSTRPQFRFSYIKIDGNTLKARFEIAPPGKPGQYSVYLEGKVRKIGMA